MKGLKFIVLGLVFGIVLSKAEVISWFRIQEMFRFQSFHMYGVIGSAVLLGMLMVFAIKKMGLKDYTGQIIEIKDKAKNYKAALLGGFTFGLGWALVGACPGPLYILVGHGYWSVWLIIAGALLGTYLYGVIKSKLPH